jgi:ectoine hydroxylase-related dioxygenase (phytanoyl-CoA dioxygenase family)
MDVKRFIHNHPELLKHIQHVYGEDYVFADYIFSIEKSSVSTCHRDENGSIINPKVTHPSFTVIFYLEDMEACLDVIPKSHRDKHSIYLSRPLKSVPCTPGQAIFFDANLIHAGSINVKDDNKRIQMKIVHKDDLEHMGEFNHYYRVGDVSKDISKQRTLFHRRVSCTFPGVADLTKNGNALPEFMGDMYKKVVYGDKDNYKLTVLQK